MAKGNMLLGRATGSVGDLTFSVSNGKQVIKVKPAQVKNPQTKAQMIQRIIMNTVAQAYSKMSEICDHSFEGINPGADSMAFFMKRNLSILRKQAADFGIDANIPRVADLGSAQFVPNVYQIAKGSLPIIPLSESGYANQGFLLPENTYASVITTYGLKRGDQLTLTIGAYNELTGDVNFHFCRIILDPREEDGTEADLSTAFITEGIIQKPNPRNENYGVALELNDNYFVFGSASNVEIAVMRAPIISRLGDDGQWLRSSAVMITDVDNMPDVFNNIEEAYENWLAGGIDVESSRYLNNAMKGLKSPTSQNASGTGGGDQPTVETSKLMISKTGNGSVVCKVDGQVVTNNSMVQVGKTVNIEITPEAGVVPRASVGGTPISLTAAQDLYTGSFTKNATVQTLVVETQDDEDPGLDNG